MQATAKVVIVHDSDELLYKPFKRASHDPVTYLTLNEMIEAIAWYDASVCVLVPCWSPHTATLHMDLQGKAVQRQ